MHRELMSMFLERSPTLLLVDSHDGSRRALAELLRDGGFEVVEAGNGAQGLEAVRRGVPDLVIVDFWPSVCGGLPMVERLRTDLATRRVPVLVLTSALSPAIRRRVSRAGCAGFLEKPCPPDDIFAAVHGILGTATFPYPAPGLRTCVSH